jgi:hypothetical protein
MYGHAEGYAAAVIDGLMYAIGGEDGSSIFSSGHIAENRTPRPVRPLILTFWGGHVRLFSPEPQRLPSIEARTYRGTAQSPGSAVLCRDEPCLWPISRPQGFQPPHAKA